MNRRRRKAVIRYGLSRSPLLPFAGITQIRFVGSVARATLSATRSPSKVCRSTQADYSTGRFSGTSQKPLPSQSALKHRQVYNPVSILPGLGDPSIAGGGAGSLPDDPWNGALVFAMVQERALPAEGVSCLLKAPLTGQDAATRSMPDRTSPRSAGTPGAAREPSPPPRWWPSWRLARASTSKPSPNTDRSAPERPSWPSRA